ncbi:MAG: STAS domain-containing protein [Egibacteraceae bacterium]
MVTTALDTRVRNHDGVAVVDLYGDIDRSAEAALTGAYAEAITSTQPILLNFADVGYINSTGIALIVGLLASARRDGSRIAACGLSEHYRQIFEITRLSDFMPLYADEPSAVDEQRPAER